MSKRGKYLEEKYFGRYIGVQSPKDNQCIESIEKLNEMLEKDNAYALLQHVHLDWLEKSFPEWCIVKIYSLKDNMLNWIHNYNGNVEKVFDRVYKTNNIKNIHLE